MNVIHLDSLPEDPNIPGARLVPDSGGIRVTPELVYLADPTIWRSVERCKEGIRWHSHSMAETANYLNAPVCLHDPEPNAPAIEPGGDVDIQARVAVEMLGKLYRDALPGAWVNNPAMAFGGDVPAIKSVDEVSETAKAAVRLTAARPEERVVVLAPIWHVPEPVVAHLPDERTIELPAGTVLRR